MVVKRSNRKAPENQGDERPKWRKLHNGIHNHRDGQIVRKGEILYAHESELSKIIQAGFECLDALPNVDLGKALSVKSRGGGWYDVVNTVNLQKLNSKPLRREAAESFLPEGQTLEEVIEVLEEETEE